METKLNFKEQVRELVEDAKVRDISDLTNEEHKSLIATLLGEENNLAGADFLVYSELLEVFNANVQSLLLCKNEQDKPFINENLGVLIERAAFEYYHDTIRDEINSLVEELAHDEIEEVCNHRRIIADQRRDNVAERVWAHHSAMQRKIFG